MIESIIIKNKKGDQIELSLEDIEELKSDLDKLESVHPQPWPTFYPTTSPHVNPWWLDHAWCGHTVTDNTTAFE